MTTRDFRLPDLGEGLTEAEVVRWLVAQGDVVSVDDPVVEVETAKSVVEVPTPFAGRVVTLHGAPGQVIEVGQPLLTVAAVEEAETLTGSGNVLIGYGTPQPQPQPQSQSGSGPESAGGGRRRRPRRAATTGLPGAPTPAPVPAPTLAPTPAPASRPRVALVTSPVVRRLARDLDIDLQALSGTGSAGAVTRDDVERHVARRSDSRSASSGERRTPLNGFRRAASTALTRSRAEIPEATVWVDVDATELWNLREAGRDATGAGPGLLAYIARFVVAALQQYPVLNSRLDTERHEIVEHDHINLGLAVQGARGLVVPACSARAP